MADQDNQNNLILNNRPPELTEDFGITTAGDELDKILMPDKTDDRKQTDSDKEKLK